MRIILSFLFLLLAFPALAVDDDYGVSDDVILTDSVTILAVSSITAPISELAIIYSQENNVDVNAVFESSGELVRQIDNGDPADIIIFADDNWMHNIQARGLIDPNSITKFMKNKLLLVAYNKISVPQNLPLPEALDYIQARMLPVMANPDDNALGIASKAVLIKTNRWQKFEKMVVLAPNAAKTNDLIIKSQTAGIVYATDYYLRKNELDLVSDIPQEYYNAPVYQGAVLVGKKMDDARNFLKFLTSAEAKKVFKKYGFIVG